MKKEPSSSYPTKRWEIKDVLVLVLIAIIFLLAGWIIQLEKTKILAVDAKERIENEADFHGRKLKDKIGEVITEKTGN